MTDGMPGIRALTLTLPPAEGTRFHRLLQAGVRVRAAAGRSVLGFLALDLGLDAEWVRRRVTTVFLDGSVVDALEGAILAPGAVLTLSAAMPGLVGATLRRGGPYAAMRAEITHAADRGGSAPPGAGDALVRVKLFNLLLDELGPALLARGVVLDRAEAIEALAGLAPPPGGWPPDGDVELRVRFS